MLSDYFPTGTIENLKEEEKTMTIVKPQYLLFAFALIASLFATVPAMNAIRTATAISSSSTGISLATALKEANAGQVGLTSWRYSTMPGDKCMFDVYDEGLHVRKNFDVPCVQLTTDELRKAMEEAKTMAKELIDKVIESIAGAKQAPGM